jgi:FBP C-terminal treble-clef zinc-finger
MQPITEKTIRASLVNASLRERKELSMPPLETLDWDNLDFLGWRDAKFALLGYTFVELDGSPVGILLRQADGRPRSRPQCSWCEDVTLPCDVAFFSARRTGPAGRKGDTVGTLVCSNFECSYNVRKAPPVAYLGFDIEAARQQRILALGEHVRAFVVDIRDGS